MDLRQLATDELACYRIIAIAETLSQRKLEVSEEASIRFLPLTMSQPGDRPSTPLAIAKAFLAGIKAQDVAAMRALVHPDATACLIREQVPRHFKLSEVLDIIESAESEMGEYSYDEVEHVDTPYKFVEDGKLHHTGTNTFVLWKSPEGWLITAVSDVARAVETGATMRLIAGST